MYWIIVDEHGRVVENVVYIDHDLAVQRRNRLNDSAATKLANKFYRLRKGGRVK